MKLRTTAFGIRELTFIGIPTYRRTPPGARMEIWRTINLKNLEENILPTSSGQPYPAEGLRSPYRKRRARKI